MSTSADLLNGDSRLQRRLRRQTRSAGDSTQEIRPISEEPKQVDPSTIDENSDPNVQDSSSESKIHRRGLKGKDRLSSSPLAKRLRLRDFDSAFSNTSASGIKEKSFLHRKNRLGAGAFGKNSQFDDFRFRKSVSTEDTRLLSGNSSCESFEHGSIADLRSTDRSTETILSLKQKIQRLLAVNKDIVIENSRMMKLNSMLEIQMKRSQGNSTFCGLNSQDSGDFSFHQISSHTSETDDLIKGPNSDCIFMDEYIEEKISLVQFIQHLQLRIHFLETVIELKNDALLRNAQDLKLVNELEEKRNTLKQELLTLLQEMDED